MGPSWRSGVGPSWRPGVRPSWRSGVGPSWRPGAPPQNLCNANFIRDTLKTVRVLINSYKVKLLVAVFFFPI